MKYVASLTPHRGVVSVYRTVSIQCVLYQL
nr:MAG TPA: hypothetical protein [Bacteriophage sp.]